MTPISVRAVYRLPFGCVGPLLRTYETIDSSRCGPSGRCLYDDGFLRAAQSPQDFKGPPGFDPRSGQDHGLSTGSSNSGGDESGALEGNCRPVACRSAECGSPAGDAARGALL